MKIYIIFIPVFTHTIMSFFLYSNTKIDDEYKILDKFIGMYYQIDRNIILFLNLAINSMNFVF